LFYFFKNKDKKQVNMNLKVPFLYFIKYKKPSNYNSFRQ